MEQPPDMSASSKLSGKNESGVWFSCSSTSIIITFLIFFFSFEDQISQQKLFFSKNRPLRRGLFAFISSFFLSSSSSFLSQFQA
jgi:hypothetical protein